ncbi:phosphatase PAP2 family protein [Motilibacter deserti]|uniref:Phosphatase PAP2 family protein n=1 Tax=Motilibacter deserti TaxID=2714956 RepID=A0ABX0H2F2_9ACTN|nr:phosphatase PAP2 family protein [Motilibacter deserti]NHC15965.1 phosphatase PAP2 family protein [Motilibacter deserti]
MPPAPRPAVPTGLGAPGGADAPGADGLGGTAALGARRDVRLLLALAAGCFAVLLGIWAFFGRTRRGMMADSYGVGGAGNLKRWLGDLLYAPLDTVSVPSLLVASCCLGAVGLARRRPRLAAAAVAVQAGGPVLTATLKQLLARDVENGWVHTLPSGHTTVATSFALAAMLVSAPRWRPAVALVGTAYAVAVGVATIGIQAHMPSDVAAAYAGTLGWALAVVAVLRATGPRAGRSGDGRVRASLRRVYWQVVVLGAAAALLGAFGLIVLGRLLLAPPEVVGSFFEAAFAGAASGVAAGALAVVAAWTVVLAALDVDRPAAAARKKVEPPGINSV